VLEWAKPTWHKAFPTMMAKPMGPFDPRSRQGNPEALDADADSDEQRHGEVGPWVGKMVGEVGDPIWSPAKEEAQQRVVSTGVCLGRRGTAVRGGVRWWRLVARSSGRLSEHGRSLGWRRRSASVAGGG
jgi:hypothetical protein